MRKVLLLGVLATAITAVSGAGAAPASTTGNGIADKGTLTIGAERLFGFAWGQESTETTDVAGGVTRVSDSKVSSTTFGLLWNGSPANVYVIPRVGIDYTIIDNLTIGGSIGYVHVGDSYSNTTTTTLNGASTTQSVSGDYGSANGFIFAPRVGYVLPLGGMLSVWLRGGLTYYNVGTSTPPQNNGNTTVSTTQSGFALSLDPQLVISPVEHFAFTVGIAADLPLAGTHSQDETTNGTTVSTSYTDHFTNLGITVGLLGYL